ncbi:MAG: pyridoxamine 5'-phosphate oxidase family protein [Anaerolineae bacterium]
MTSMPQTVSEAWEKRQGPIVFGTVDTHGTPNLIYMTCVKKVAEDQIILVDNFFNKTRANIAAGSKGALAFITDEGKSFQIKGTLEYQAAGPVYDDMKCWNSEKLPGVAAVVLHVEQVFSGATQLV